LQEEGNPHAGSEFIRDTLYISRFSKSQPYVFNTPRKKKGGDYKVYTYWQAFKQVLSLDQYFYVWVDCHSCFFQVERCSARPCLLFGGGGAGSTGTGNSLADGIQRAIANFRRALASLFGGGSGNGGFRRNPGAAAGSGANTGAGGGLGGNTSGGGGLGGNTGAGGSLGGNTGAGGGVGGNTAAGGGLGGNTGAGGGLGGNTGAGVLGGNMGTGSGLGGNTAADSGGFVPITGGNGGIGAGSGTGAGNGGSGAGNTGSNAGGNAGLSLGAGGNI